jgi:zinc protease
MRLFFLAAPLLLAIAPVTATPAPSTRPAVLAADTTTSQFEINGLKVILRRNTSTDVVAANLYLLGGSRQLTPQTQGIEALLFAASERGSRKYPGPRLRQELARRGSVINVSLNEDWTTYSLKSIRTAFDTSWAIFADRLLAPTLTQADVDLVRTQMITAEQSDDLRPEALVSRLADSVAFAGHPYAMETDGTTPSLTGLGPAQLREYMQRTFVTSRMLLVVVGNVDRAKLERLVGPTIAALPKGDYVWQTPPVVPRRKALVVRPASLPTNYILGYYAGPAAGTADYNALRLATAILSGRFYTEIRSKRSLSYAPDAPFVERAVATGGVYVTTVDPNTTLAIMRNEISRLQAEPIDREGLDQLVEQFITEYFLKNETNSDQASFLARAAIYQGDYRAAERFVGDLRRITPEDVRQAARTYMRDFRFAYVGDPARLDRSLIDRF